MRVALVHDYLTQAGGAERVLEAFVEQYPNAPIYTLLYDEEGTRGAFAGRDIRTSFLQRIPFAKRRHRLFPPLMPIATESMDLSEYDLVISSSWSFTKGIITPVNTVHVSFCHTPLRYAWDDSHRYIDEFRSFPRIFRQLARPALTYLRLWDFAAAQRPDRLVANSSHVAKRIKKYYGRDAAVVYPPVRVEYFAKEERNPGDAFLMAGRLMSYKRFDLGILAAEQAGAPLRIVGEGPEMRNLRKLAQGKDVTFLGGISDEALRQEFAKAKAFLFPQEEDFGIVAVEALATGTPVIAYRAGGATEIIEEGRSGLFFDEQTSEALAEQLRGFDVDAFDVSKVRDRANHFSKQVFSEAMRRIVLDAIG